MSAPITPEMRLEYVLRHFRLAYENVPDLEISYAPTAAVVVTDHAGDFFAETEAYPPAFNLRERHGQRIPFFFDPRPDQLLMRREADRVLIAVDVVSAAFYLLSGWQEYFNTRRDPHGRFPYSASIQKKHRFVQIPAVNYYFDVLREALEYLTDQPLQPRRWGPAQAPFATFVSHDVDSLHGGWGRALRYAQRRGEFGLLLRLLFRRAINKPAPWNNLSAVQAATASYAAPSTFFVLAENRAATDGTLNADYELDPAALAALAAEGAEIALHGSYDSPRRLEQLQAERLRLLPHPAPGNRFHYLNWEPHRTPTVVAQAGFAYDSTLGFAEHYGFRNSYCHPFFPWDFSTGQAFGFLEIPLTLMDTTLNHARYLQVKPANLVSTIARVMAEVQRFGGVFTLLWHNENFDPTNNVNGPRQFHALMTELQGRGTAFLTGSQIVAEVNGEED